MGIFKKLLSVFKKEEEKVVMTVMSEGITDASKMFINCYDEEGRRLFTNDVKSSEPVCEDVSTPCKCKCCNCEVSDVQSKEPVCEDVVDTPCECDCCNCEVSDVQSEEPVCEDVVEPCKGDCCNCESDCIFDQKSLHKCLIDGCTHEGRLIRGMCRTHYEYLRRKGVFNKCMYYSPEVLNEINTEYRKLNRRP